MASKSGIEYFIQGFSLISTKGVKRFVLVPLTVNILLFTGAFIWGYQQLDEVFLWIKDSLPDWLMWLETVFVPLAAFLMLVFFMMIFSIAANWIAAPFNGLLAERIEAHLTQQTPPPSGIVAIAKDVPRTIHREWRKLAYYIPRAIGFFILFLILPVIGQLIWILFSGWMMAVQYCDYPFDNHKTSFDDMKSMLRRRKGLTFSFGLTVMLFAAIPFVNLIVMPVAICGATALFVDNFRSAGEFTRRH